MRKGLRTGLRKGLMMRNGLSKGLGNASRKRVVEGIKETVAEGDEARVD